MRRISPQAVGAVSAGLISAATGGLGLPKPVWLVALGIGLALGVWAAIRSVRGSDQPKLSERLQALADEIADLHLRVTLTAPKPTGHADFEAKMLESDAHRTMTRAEWGRDFVPRIYALLDETEAAGIDTSFMSETPWGLLAGPHPIQDVAGRLATLASRARRAKL